MKLTDSVKRQLDAGELSFDLLVEAFKKLEIETPSWGYANSGTRFKTFACPGAALTLDDKIEDAALVHKLTGTAPSVALHIPWDKVDDWGQLSAAANEQGVKIGAINPNVFQADEYKLGSICNPDPSVRKKAVNHMVECCQIMEAVGSDILSIWLADGTNYAGQDSIFDRRLRMKDSLAEVYSHLPSKSKILLEYKFYEPAFYHTDIADWGTSFALCLGLGDKAEVLVDTGHHAPGTSIPYVIVQLLAEKRLGGFHFNSRNYGDDDLIVGAANPWEIFLIFYELVSAGAIGPNLALMIDQSHNIEPKLQAMILSVLNCQAAYVKALLIDQKSLRAAQQSGDVLGAHTLLTDAFNTDVRDLVAALREAIGASADPMADLKASGEEERRAKARPLPSGGGGGYPSS